MSRPAVLTFLLLAAAPALAVDTVDLQVAPRARVLGTLRPTDERESYLVATVRGASVRAVAKRSGDGPNPAIELLDGTSTLLATGRTTRTGSKIQRFEVPTGGLCRFRVTGDGVLDGDFELELTLSPRELWTGTSEDPLAPGAEATFSFAAPAGATADVEVRRASGGLAPRILGVTGPSGALVAAGEPRSSRLHEIEDLAIPVSGEHSVRFRNDGGSSGRWRVRVKLRILQEVRTETDLRGDTLGGEFDDVQTVFGRIATPEADTLIVGPPGTSLENVSLLIPAGALPTATLIGITEAEPFVVSEEVNPAGQAVAFTPAGTTFDPPASITAPYDPQAFDDPALELTAVVVEDPETGVQETIPVTSVDTGAQTVTYPTSHFSRFQPVSPRPRSLRGLFTEVEFVGTATSGFGGSLTLGLNSFEGLSGTRSQHGLQRNVRRLTVAWRTDATTGPTLSASADERLSSGVVTVDSNQLVTLTNGAGDLTLARGVSPDALAGAAPRKGGVESYLVFRQADGVPMRGNLVGGWHGAVFEFSATAEKGRVVLRLADETFELDVDKAGRASATENVLRTSTAEVGASSWKHELSTRVPKPGALDPDRTSARLTLAVGSSSALREASLDPVMRGDALIGGGTTVVGDPGSPSAVVLRLVILLRRSSGFVPKAVLGRSAFASFAALPVSGNGPIRVDFAASVADLLLSSDATFDLTGTRATIGHSILGGPSAAATTIDSGGVFRVNDDGRIDFGKFPLLAFAAPRRDALLFVDPFSTGYLAGAAVPATKLERVPIFGR